jgi:hypothetical protein
VVGFTVYLLHASHILAHVNILERGMTYLGKAYPKEVSSYSIGTCLAGRHSLKNVHRRVSSHFICSIV